MRRDLPEDAAQFLTGLHGKRPRSLQLMGEFAQSILILSYTAHGVKQCLEAMVKGWLPNCGG